MAFRELDVCELPYNGLQTSLMDISNVRGTAKLLLAAEDSFITPFKEG